ASAEAFDLARRWVQGCIQNHPACAAESELFMPKRILEISSSTKSIHVRNNASPAPYAALSYCWGGPQRVTLTLSHLGSPEVSFPTNTLPSTIQDAVRVCGELGLNYLWVDALCIVQDDPEDKAVEISNMADIYRNSYVTISASRAKTVDLGFLQPRSPLGAGNDPCAFRLPYESKDRVAGSVVLIEEASSQLYVDPLSTRAWAFQEFVLSPRVLDYGELRTTWICKADNKPTDGFMSSPTSCWSRQRFHELFSAASKATLKPHELWSVLVQCYMSGDLTEASDRLPALAGIASRFHQIIQDDYIAGCWKKHIWLDLLWWHEATEQKRPSRYFAPSWSWASIPNTYGKFNCISTNSCLVDDAFEVLDYKIQPLHQGFQYGSLASGFLQIRGRIVAAECLPALANIQHNNTNTEVDVPGHVRLPLSSSIIRDPEFQQFDCSACPVSGLLVCWDKKRSLIRGILLCEVKPEYFIRAGLLTVERGYVIPGGNGRSNDWTKAVVSSFKVWRESLPIKRMKIF
ncbi:heterokaryon incompatibility protein-domain-containing protein, partial [Thelonectria olida]